jgi:anaerobic selenocysteine-containing dehydrogenase
MLQYKGRWQEISWEDALEICAEQLALAYQEDPAQIVHISGHGARGMSKMAVDGFFAALGSTRISGSVCDGTGIEAFQCDFGSLEQGPLDDLKFSRWIINWGRDFARSSIHTLAMVTQARKNGTRVVSIWPGGQGYADFSDQLIRITPGRDRFLALAVLKVIWEQGRIAQQAVAATRNWDALQATLQSFTLPQLAGLCEVSEKDIYYLAAAYSQSPVASVIGWGVQRHRFGGESIRSIDALTWLSGNVGSPGSGVYYNISSVRNVDLSWLPDNTARYLNLPCLGSDILQTQDPALTLAWINGTNPVNQLPESRTVARALQSVNFVVVVDAFWTDTALCADLVLPCTLMGEEDDVLGSCMHDYVNYARKVQDPPPGVRSDLWMVQELNTRLGLGLTIPERKELFQRGLQVGSPEQAWEQLQATGYVLAREQGPAFASGPAHPDGRFHALGSISPASAFGGRYPLQLLSLIRREAIHSQILPKDQDMPPTVWVNPQAYGLQDVDLSRDVYLISELGRLRVQVAFDSTLHPQVVVYRRGDWMKLGGGVNQLIRAEVSDLRVGSAQYSQRVRLSNEC